MKDIILNFRSHGVGKQQKKFSTKHLSGVASKIFTTIENQDINQRIVFDLSDLEWIGHEELVFLSGIFRYLKDRKLKFYVTLKPKEEISPRKARQIITLWDKWRIAEFVSFDATIGAARYDEYFDIDSRYINYLFSIYPELREKSTNKTPQIYSWYRITPFYSLSAQAVNIDSVFFKQELEKMYALEKHTLDLLKENHSETPFLNKTLSYAVTRELRENAIEHAFDNVPIELQNCYVGVSLKHKLSEESRSKKGVSSLNEKNFEDEWIPEAINFFKDKNTFKNQSYLQFTFIDFGNGIANTLHSNYIQYLKKSGGTNKADFDDQRNNFLHDSKVIEYAFDYTSSRFPLEETFERKEIISRGLFDVAAIIRRYRGLMIIRSGYGKVLIDYSKAFKNPKVADDPHDYVKYFGNSDEYFKGSMISIYIPENSLGISLEVIKPIFNKQTEVQKEAKYFSVLVAKKKAIDRLNIERQEKDKGKEYSYILSELDEFLSSLKNGFYTVYIDFAALPGNIRIFKKIFQYLSTSYHIIPERVNAIIINPPDLELIQEISLIQRSDSDPLKSLKYHATPCIYNLHNYHKKNNSEIEGRFQIVWLGVQNDQDADILTEEIQFEMPSYKRQLDFLKPDSIGGNIVSFDNAGNLIKHISNFEELAIESLVISCITNEPDKIYLAAGNYYQEEFLSFLEKLQDFQYSELMALKLIDELESRDLIDKFDTIISITLTSQLLVRAFEDVFFDRYPQNKLQILRLSSYHSFQDELAYQTISAKNNVALLCDVVATGFLVKKLSASLNKKNAKLITVISLVDTRSKNVNNIPNFRESIFEEISDINIISLYKKPVNRYILNPYPEKKVIRINPITNDQSTLSIDKSEKDKIIYYEFESFLKQIKEPENFLKIGFIENNTSLHTYYVEIDRILKEQPVQLLKTLLGEIKQRELIRVNKNSIEKTSSRFDFIDYHINKLKIELPSENVLLGDITLQLAKLKLSSSGTTKSDLPDIDVVFYPILSGIDHIKHSVLSEQIFSDPRISIYPLPRINTTGGWRFTFPPKFLNERVKSKNILILDDGSLTGDTVIQLISEVAYYEVNRIIVLSIIGRVKDFQREFLTRMQEIKVKRFKNNEIEATGETLNDVTKNVPIHVYFATHLHIPAFHRDRSNDFYKENLKLIEYLRISNIPLNIRDYILFRITEIKRHNTLFTLNNILPKYLPIDRKTLRPPLIRLFKYRDVIGRLQSFRFFKEYFVEIEEIIQYYNKEDYENDIDHWEKIELILAILIHEENLIQIINDLFPDLLIHIRKFLKKIFISEEILLKDLYYLWEAYPLTKLFYIFFTEVKFENESELLLSCIKFAEKDNTHLSLNLLCFLLFKELAHSNEENFIKVNKEWVYVFIDDLTKNYSASFKPETIRDIERLLSYCNTNPFISEENNFHFCSLQLHRFYSQEEIVKGRNHNNLEKHNGIILSCLQELEDGVLDLEEQSEDIEKIINAWIVVKESLELITKYALGIQEILIKYDEKIIYNQIIGNSYSVMNKINVISERIFNNKIISEVPEFMKEVQFFKKRVILHESPCRSFFGEYITDLIKIWKMEFSNITKLKNFKMTDKLESAKVYLHKPIVQKIIFRELASNMEHADINEPIICSWKIEDNFYIFYLKTIRKTLDYANENKRTGLQNIESIKDFYNLFLEYTNFETESDTFEILLKFPKIN